MKKISAAEIMREVRKASCGSRLNFVLDKLDRKAEKVLSDKQLAALCREKELFVFIEVSPGERGNKLPTAWRLFTLRQLASCPEHTVLDAGKLKYLPCALPWDAVLCAGKVAGYHTLAFDKPSDRIPLLYVHPEYGGLYLALFSLSDFVRSRFAPYCKWRDLYQWFTGLTPAEAVIKTRWMKDESLPVSAEEECRKAAYKAICETFCYRENGVLKVAEGFSGEVLEDGSQKFRKLERSDCVLETAAALAVSGICGNSGHQEMADEIIRRVMSDPEHTVLDRTDPCTALMNFYVKSPTYYVSGNSQGALLLAAVAKAPQFREQILRMMFALYRLTGTAGNARNSFKVPDSFLEHSWDFYGKEEYRYPCPHRQAALWSMLLTAWKLTGFQPFGELAKKGIDDFMALFPDIPWTNDYSAELAKMLRPLSFLYRMEPSAKHKKYLDAVVDGIEKLMLPCGAVRASLHILQNGLYPPPGSNEDYGKSEASLIQTEKDICCDLLYTQVFALAGMHEAAVATGDERYKNLSDKLAEFLVRIQINSFEHQELTGLWMRAFDPEMWEYFASSADGAWGAWCIESGWTNAPAAMVLALRKAGKGLFDLLPADGEWADILPQIREEMKQIHPVPERKQQDYIIIGVER